MAVQHSMIESMRSRQSIRTFDDQPLSEDHFNLINNFIEQVMDVDGPFGKTGTIRLVKVSKNVTEKGIKLGTYGFIKNPKGYLVGICENDKYSLVGFAYVFHGLLLQLTSLGIGSCWMGGTFTRHSFEQEISLQEGEFIPCITPIGFPKDKQRMFDKALRLAVKADNKKSWDRLFFYTNFQTVLTKEKAASLEIPIEMVRLGPSASNKQPWRLVLNQELQVCHFYIEHTPNYSTSLGYDMQLLDMGIAMCQFDLACQELNIKGDWQIEDPKLNVPNKQVEYIVSWRYS